MNQRAAIFLRAAVSLAWAVESKPVLGGYDVVNYFESSASVLGTADHAHNLTSQDCASSEHPGACVDRFNSEFWFASEDHRIQFASDPWKYAPRYGGF